MKLIFLVIGALFVFFISQTLFAQQNNQRNTASRMSPLGCSFAGIGEYLLPGVGYLVSSQYGKAVGFGAIRWSLAINAGSNMRSKYYQKDSDETFQSKEAKDTESEKNEIVFNYNKETWNAQYYNRVQSNIGLYNIWDLYEGGCAPHDTTFEPPTAIFRPWVYGKRVLFWIPTLFIFAAYHYNDGTNYTWYLGRGLKREDIERDSVISAYTTGIGEETLFRGTFQNSIYYFYKNHFDTDVAYHLGVFTASVVFGLAHSGQGLSANPLTAFGMGMYLGYTYQTTPNTFDLITPIAIHTLWNTLIALKSIKDGTFHESDDPVAKDVKIQLANFHFEF